MKTELEKLQGKLDRLLATEQKEKQRVYAVGSNIPWGAGMRRTKCTPSYAKLNSIQERVRELKERIKQLTDDSGQD